MDLKITDNNDGGEVSIFRNDFETISGFENMPYLALFSGSNYWANGIFFNESQSFNSETEQVLKEVSLTSTGVLRIEEAVNNDLEFMRAFADVTAEIIVIEINRVQINISIQEPDSLANKEFQFIWDQTRQGLIDVTNRSAQDDNTIIEPENFVKFDNDNFVKFDNDRKIKFK